jgi:hypothetical protein
MPPKNITLEPSLHYVDFGSNLPASLMPEDRIPGAWLGDSDSDYEEFSDPNLTKSEARALFKEAMADLQRTTAEADEQRLRRQGRRALREELTAEEGRRLVNVAPKDSKTLAWNGMASLQREIEERLRSQVLYEHRAVEGRSWILTRPRASRSLLLPASRALSLLLKTMLLVFRPRRSDALFSVRHSTRVHRQAPPTPPFLPKATHLVLRATRFAVLSLTLHSTRVSRRPAELPPMKESSYP